MRWLIYPGLILVGALLVYCGGELGSLLFLVFMGGVLAYLGDQLGIYWGKKRISVMGMRPKNTAVFISVVTGLVITLLTLVVASYLNENVRIALFKIGQLVERQRTLEADNFRREAENKTLEATNRALRSEKSDLDARNRELLRKIEWADQSLVQLKEDKRKTIAEIERLVRIVEKKETELVVIHKGQALLANPLLVGLDADREEISRLVDKLLADLRQAAQSLGTEIEIESFHRAAAQLIDSILIKFSVIREACLRDNLEVANCCIQPISTRNVSIGEKLTSVNFEVKPNLLIYHKNEEVARTSLDGRLSEERILDQLFYFDRQVLAVLRDKGVSQTSLHIRTQKISASQLLNFYKIVKLVRELRRTVMVRFVALSPVHSYGEIDAVYKVEELEGPWTPAGRELGQTAITSEAHPVTTTSAASLVTTSSASAAASTTPVLAGAE